MKIDAVAEYLNTENSKAAIENGKAYDVKTFDMLRRTKQLIDYDGIASICADGNKIISNASLVSLDENTVVIGGAELTFADLAMVTDHEITVIWHNR